MFLSCKTWQINYRKKSLPALSALSQCILNTDNTPEEKQRKLPHGLVCPQALMEAEGKKKGEAATGSACFGSEPVMDVQ